jgi:thioredoxin 1
MKDCWKGIKQVGESNLKNFIQSDGVTVMIFGSQWCGPCKLLMPNMEALAEKYKNVSFLYIDTDDNPQAVKDCDVRSLPTTIFLVNGKPVKTRLGAMGEEYIEVCIETSLDVWRKNHIPNREKELEVIIEEAKKELAEIQQGVSWEEACLVICNNMDNPDDKVIVYPIIDTEEKYEGFEGIGKLYYKHSIQKKEGKYKIVYEHY